MKARLILNNTFWLGVAGFLILGYLEAATWWSTGKPDGRYAAAVGGWIFHALQKAWDAKHSGPPEEPKL